MRSNYVFAIVLLAACGGPSNNKSDVGTPDLGTGTVSTTDTGTGTATGTDSGVPDTKPAIDTTPSKEVQVDPCASVTCGSHGTCVAGSCVCSANWYGPKCNFGTEQFSAAKVFCASDSGKLEISGATGSESYLNGYFIDVPVGAVDRCAIFFLSPALGTNLPSPATGKIVPVAHGLEVTAVDKDAPLLPDGNLNKVTLLQDVGVFFNNNRGEVLLFDSGDFTTLATTVVQNGTLGKTRHFSPFYLNVGEPVVAASAMHAGNREVIVDFSGTVHAGSAEPFMLRFSASEGGTPLMLTADATNKFRFRTTLAGGTHVLSATVADQYGDSGSKQISLTVDLCSTVTCQSYQTCRTSDGVCVGADPCSPNPCVHGTCSSATGSAICTSCADGWKGTLCDVQDLCFGKTCNGHGTCTAATGACQCAAGFDPAKNCSACLPGYSGNDCSVKDLCFGVTCADDGLFCNGVEACEPTTGKCIHKDAPTCSGHGTCNESTDSCSCDANFGGNSCNTCAAGTIGTYPSCSDDPCLPNPCGNGGTCSVSGTSAVCACTNHWNPATSCTTCSTGWTGSDCNTPVVTDPCAGISCSGHGTCGGGTCSCSTGYTGSACNTCATGYQGYPTCVPIPPAPTISITPLACASNPGYCSGGTYTVSFTYTGSVTTITGYCTVTGGADPGAITNITYSGGTGTFTYTTSPDGSGQEETLHLTITGPGGTNSGSETHWVI